MRQDSPRWEHINRSAFEHENDGLRELAAYLPDADPYRVWANVEFVGTDGSINEVDALVLTPSGLYVLELKHWQGELAGDGTQWVRRMPGGRLTPEDNPLILANRKAKRLATLIRYYARQQGREAQAPFVGAAVFLHARALRSRLDEIGRQRVYGLDGHTGESGLPSLKDFLTDPPANPRHLVTAATGQQIIELVKGAKIRPSVADRRIGQLILHPHPVAEGIGWQDFLASHSLNKTLVRRVRFYLTSRATSDELPVIKRAAEREFRLLQGIHHPGIAHPTDLTDHPLGTAVIFEHTPGAMRLDQWLVQREKKLTTAQKLRLVQDLAEIIDYAHSRRLAHRALHPRALYVRDPDRPRPELLITDWQAGGRFGSSTRLPEVTATGDSAGLELFFDDETRLYQAPEGAIGTGASGTQLDVFGLGALAFRIFTGMPPAETPERLVAILRNQGLHIDAMLNGAPQPLITLVYDATHGDPSRRPASVGQFRQELERVWEELTKPEPEPVTDPLEANKGDLLNGRYEVKRRLGSGATSTALLVTDTSGASERDLVLKVARDEQYAERLETEAATLSKLGYAQVARLIDGPVTVGSRTALLLESAGEQTLAEILRGGRLAFEMLKRYGRDLLDIVRYLHGEGVWHRDLKPANLAARPRPSDREPHLCAFDFSLSATPADQLGAGTPPYLDPFLGSPGRAQYDAAAERYAAAVTLYEMATGSLPRWGDDANPATISDEVTLDPSAFDHALADRLVPFFRKALARDATVRFDTVEEMTDAWLGCFVEPETRSDAGAPDGAAPIATTVTRTTALEATDLTVRARSALERLGVHTVGELLDYAPSALTRAPGIPNATRREIAAQTRALRGLVDAAPAATADPARKDEERTARGVEAVCATLVPAATARNAKEIAAARLLLGQNPTPAGAYLRWPSQSDVAGPLDQTQSQISTWMRKWTPNWLANRSLTLVRDEIAALLEARGGVMSAEEVAEALAAARGCFTLEPARLPLAIGLVRAAVEAELTRGGDARLAIRRFRGSDTVLIGLEPADPAADATSTAEARLAYTVTLGQRAAKLAQADPLHSRTAALDELRGIATPPGMPLLSEQRLLQLAAVASNGEAALSTQNQFYPVGMPAERALRLSAGWLGVQRIDEHQLRTRVRARFPQAATLPPRHQGLDRLVEDCSPLRWDAAQQAYTTTTVATAATSTRMATTSAPLSGPTALAEVDLKLATAVKGDGFLAVLASLRSLDAAREALLAAFDLVEVDVTAILLDRLRAAGLPWDLVLAADTGITGDVDYRALLDMVAHDVLPAVTEALAVARPALITEAAPLARYGQIGVLRELSDQTRRRPAARLLLAPTRSADPPALLDDVQLPLVSPASQSLWLPDAWVAGKTERTHAA